MAPLGYETKDRNSYYGISDLAALATDTHKFELHYIDWLIERYQPGSSLYHDRSPINFVQNLSVPVIFFHGEDDPVVPVNQAKTMFSALKGRGIATCLLIFQGEKHGFRQSGHVRQSLEAELLFYAKAHLPPKGPFRNYRFGTEAFGLMV